MPFMKSGTSGRESHMFCMSTQFQLLLRWKEIWVQKVFAHEQKMLKQANRRQEEKAIHLLLKQ